MSHFAEWWKLNRSEHRRDTSLVFCRVIPYLTTSNVECSPQNRQLDSFSSRANSQSRCKCRARMMSQRQTVSGIKLNVVPLCAFLNEFWLLYSTTWSKLTFTFWMLKVHPILTQFYFLHAFSKTFSSNCNREMKRLTCWHLKIWKKQPWLVTEVRSHLHCLLVPYLSYCVICWSRE